MSRTSFAALVVGTLALAAAPGCKSSNEGSWIGTGVGTVAGAGAGYAVGGTKGALIGAGVGALGGYIVGTELGHDSTAEHNATAAHQQSQRFWDQANEAASPQQRVYYLEQAWSADRTHPEIPHNMGVAYMDMGDRAAARQHFELALQVDPDFQPSRDALARINL